MAYDSEPIPSYNELRNRSYYIMLNYRYFSSTPQIHLLCPDPTISSYGSFLVPLCLGTDLINGAVCHLFRYGCLLSLNILL